MFTAQPTLISTIPTPHCGGGWLDTQAKNKANIQLSLGITYSYHPSSVVHRPEFKDEIVRAAEVFLPFYHFVMPQ